MSDCLEDYEEEACVDALRAVLRGDAQMLEGALFRVGDRRYTLRVALERLGACLATGVLPPDDFWVSSDVALRLRRLLEREQACCEGGSPPPRHGQQATSEGTG